MLRVTVVIKHFVTYFGLQTTGKRICTELNVPEKITINYISSLYI